jgi:hypothetical protein
MASKNIFIFNSISKRARLSAHCILLLNMKNCEAFSRRYEIPLFTFFFVETAICKI